MGKNYRNRSSVVEVPKRAYEKDRLDAEMKVVGQFGLKNKREIRRVNLILSRLRKAARELLTLSEDDPKRIFEGAALMRRCFRLGLLSQEENKLDYILGLTIPKFMERRLQTVVLKSNFNARSIHHARVMIRQRHFRVGKQLVNVPSFMVRVDREKQIDFASTSPFGVGRPGRVARRNAKNKKGGEEDN